MATYLKSESLMVKTKRGNKKCKITRIMKTHPRGVYSIDVSVDGIMFCSGCLFEAKNKKELIKKVRKFAPKRYNEIVL